MVMRVKRLNKKGNLVQIVREKVKGPTLSFEVIEKKSGDVWDYAAILAGQDLREKVEGVSVSKNWMEGDEVVIGVKKELGVKEIKSIIRGFISVLPAVNFNINCESILNNKLIKIKSITTLIEIVVRTVSNYVFPSFNLKSDGLNSSSDNSRQKKCYLVVSNIDEEKENRLTDQLAFFEAIEKNRRFVQKLQDLPPNYLNPTGFIDQLKSVIDSMSIRVREKIKMEVLEVDDERVKKMGIFLSIARGSRTPAKFVILNYVGSSGQEEELKKLALVGKGITFDSGGYSLKNSAVMREMKFDMSGAAIVCGSLLAVAESFAAVNLVAIAPLTENTITADSVLPDSVVRGMSGITVEIENTDAEGRLVLADAITYALKEEKATHVVEVSTLTGAIITALGKDITGVFSNSEKFYKVFADAAAKANENIWRMPLTSEHVQNMKWSKIADLKNMHKNGLGASSSHAAAFLKVFAEDKPFIHLDIAGTGWKNGRGTAVMLKTLCLLSLSDFFTHK